MAGGVAQDWGCTKRAKEPVLETKNPGHGASMLPAQT